MDYVIPFFIVVFVLLTGRALWSRNRGPKPYKDVSVDDFKQLSKQPNSMVLDVRSSREIAQGKIKGAMELNVLDPSFRNNIKKLDKNKSYLVYCRSGSRSGKACRLMAKEGFDQLYNLAGGYQAWKKQA